MSDVVYDYVCRQSEHERIRDERDGEQMVKFVYESWESGASEVCIGTRAAGTAVITHVDFGNNLRLSAMGAKRPPAANRPFVSMFPGWLPVYGGGSNVQVVDREHDSDSIIRAFLYARCEANRQWWAEQAWQRSLISFTPEAMGGATYRQLIRDWLMTRWPPADQSPMRMSVQQSHWLITYYPTPAEAIAKAVRDQQALTGL